MSDASSNVPSAVSRFRVGIDLGTTNTVVAFSDAAPGTEPDIVLFELEQLIGAGEVAARPSMPSVRYHPSEGELAPADLRVPWQGERAGAGHSAVIGEWARKLGSRSQGRMVASAKSWLSHPSVDRTAAILPWGAPAGVFKVSPVEASASYLDHVRQDWNRRFPNDPLERQDLVVTVPASFDEAARALTIEAARAAGLSKIRLLEEPQAACYDWLWQHRSHLQQALAGVRVILVCDVGGGTTDFSLMRVDHSGPEPVLTRIGVGNHLMLGGDNIDLALAHRAEEELSPEGRRLSGGELTQLIDQCRAAKERLLSPDGPEQATVTLLGGGSRVIGGARSVSISRAETLSLVLEGFFPKVAASDTPDRRRSGVVEFGLPYASDPAITRHLAAFLAQHRGVLADHLGESEPPFPDALLLNGGGFRSAVIADRIVALLADWRGKPPMRLNNERPEQAVALGAVAYALARAGAGLRRIEAGSARSYFLMVDTDSEQAERRGVCVLPKGSPEGETIALADRKFLLRLGQPVRFILFSSTDDRVLVPGDIVPLDDDRFVELPPLAVAFDAEHGAPIEERAVRLIAAMTEVGTLDLQCVDVAEPSTFWSVEFLLRPRPDAGQTIERVSAHPRLVEAEAQIHRLFGRRNKELESLSVKTLRASLERTLGARESWDSALCRAVFGALLDGLPHRRRSSDHERVWLNMAGYCLRPGFGFPLDDWRIAQVWTIYREGLQFVKESQNWAEWWTLWRRIAGGLESDAQNRIFEDIREFVDPSVARQGNRAAVGKKRSYEDMVRLAASLERLEPAVKAELGGWLLERLRKPGEPDESWWALGRVGSRVPFHGSAHHVVPPATAEGWLNQLMGWDWRKNPGIGFAAMLIARASGDRERDIGSELRDAVAARLRSARAPEAWTELVCRPQELSAAEERRIFGEALPSGLALID